MNTPKNETTSNEVSGRQQRLVRHLDLCSGIGGFALAAQWVGGIETIGFCDIDPWAQRVLAKNFPNVPIHDNLKTLDIKNYGRIDFISCGYPCQPFSGAGERKGTEDDRHLWPEVFRIIKEARPCWVLCENVTGHIDMGLDQVLSDLEGAGYAAEAIVIPACAVDAPHRRDRVWIIANNMCIGRWPRERGNLDMHTNIYPQHSGGERFTNERRCDKSEKFSIPWREAHSKFCFVDDGFSRKLVRPSLKGLGNAIVPQVAAEILRVMMTVDSYYPPNVKLNLRP